jgi:hypothetical protein
MYNIMGILKGKYPLGDYRAAGQPIASIDKANYDYFIESLAPPK